MKALVIEKTDLFKKQFIVNKMKDKEKQIEEMIGKQVTYDTFHMYENMYSALPENINKQQFVDMLNIDVIPEDPEAIERRKKREEFINDIKDQIAGRKADIKYFEQENARYRRYIKEEESEEDIKLYRNWIRGNNRYIEKLRAEIKELKWLIA